MLPQVVPVRSTGYISQLAPPPNIVLPLPLFCSFQLGHHHQISCIQLLLLQARLFLSATPYPIVIPSDRPHILKAVKLKLDSPPAPPSSNHQTTVTKLLVVLGSNASIRRSILILVASSGLTVSRQSRVPVCVDSMHPSPRDGKQHQLTRRPCSPAPFGGHLH